MRPYHGHWLGPPDVIDVLAALPNRPRAAVQDYAALFARSHAHGVLRVVFDALREEAPLLAAREVEEPIALAALENELSLRALGRVLGALRRAAVRSVVLKGPILAERLYGSPFARSSVDIDLLVDPSAFERAVAALATVGYERARSGPFAKAGLHHLVLFHSAFPNLELHHCAQSGFGTRLEATPLLDRSVAWHSAIAGEVSVLAPPDELVYLAVHAAAHRFDRLVWLYDLKRLLLHEVDVALAAERARASGVGRVLAFTGQILTEVLAVPLEIVRPLGRVGRLRAALLKSVTSAPSAELLRSAMHFVHSNALCGSAASCARYSVEASIEYAASRIARASGLTGSASPPRS